MSASIAIQMAKLRGTQMGDPMTEVTDRAVTTRPSSMAVFGVDSDDRYKDYATRRTNPSYPFSINITKSESLLNGFFTRIAVSEFRMYWTLPNIGAVWGNNTLTYYESVTPATHTITIPPGFYDLQTLMGVIEALVQADGFLPAFVATANVDGSSSYGTGSGATFYWVPPTTATRTLYDMLNLVNTLPTPTAATTQQGGIANLKPTDFIDVVSPQLTYNQDLKDGSTASVVRDMLVRIYLDDENRQFTRTQTNLFDASGNPAGHQVPQYTPDDGITGTSPFMLYRQFPYPKQVQWNNTQPIGNLTFELYDDQGRSIQTLWNTIQAPNTPAGAYYANSFVWNATLLISEN
jgi:hypothetical protein